jgi:putative flippase GtrA
MKKLVQEFPALGQIIRYGIVGVLNNLLGYCIYLVVTLWLDPEIAISLLYPIGATTAYFGHSKYSFAYQGGKKRSVWRYIVAHFISYLVNLLLLYIFWQKLKFPHQAVQAIAIVVCAGVLFLLFKFFVFRPNTIKTA